jgi:cyclophilin family peptidyl-prolyl cis-trans isomerase
VGGIIYFKSVKPAELTKPSDNLNNNLTVNNIPQAQTQTPAEQPVTDKVNATVNTNMGSFELALDAKAAPQTVANFVKLSNEGFYNGLKFFRIVQGFMIQGGDPKNDGTGGPGYTVPAEIGLKHLKGAIAMARTGDQVNPKKDSSGSQFYITLDAQPSLDAAGYTVFGYVTSGMDVVEKIGAIPTDVNPASGEQSVPLKDAIINKITIKQ